MTAYDEMLGSVWTTPHMPQVCAGCSAPIIQVADGCWAHMFASTAQCPTGGLHRP